MMTGADVASLLRDTVQEPSKLHRNFDSLASEMGRGLDEVRHHRKQITCRVERVLPRRPPAWVCEGPIKQNQRESQFAECDYIKVGVSLPMFNGSSLKLDFLDWLDTFQDYFEAVNLTDAIKCKLVASKLRGAARTWWKELQHIRFLEGKNPITSWSRMSKHLIKKFLHTSRLSYLHNQSSKPSDEGNLGNTKPVNCSTKCLVQSYNSNKAESSMENNGNGNSSSAVGGSVEEQSKEIVEGKPGTCSINAPLELEFDKLDEENEITSLRVSEPTCKDISIETFEKTTSQLLSVGDQVDDSLEAENTYGVQIVLKYELEKLKLLHKKAHGTPEFEVNISLLTINTPTTAEENVEALAEVGSDSCKPDSSIVHQLYNMEMLGKVVIRSFDPGGMWKANMVYWTTPETIPFLLYDHESKSQHSGLVGGHEDTNMKAFGVVGELREERADRQGEIRASTDLCDSKIICKSTEIEDLVKSEQIKPTIERPLRHSQIRGRSDDWKTYGFWSLICHYNLKMFGGVVHVTIDPGGKRQCGLSMSGLVQNSCPVELLHSPGTSVISKGGTELRLDENSLSYDFDASTYNELKESKPSKHAKDKAEENCSLGLSRSEEKTVEDDFRDEGKREFETEMVVSRVLTCGCFGRDRNVFDRALNDMFCVDRRDFWKRYGHCPTENRRLYNKMLGDRVHMNFDPGGTQECKLRMSDCRVQDLIHAALWSFPRTSMMSNEVALTRLNSNLVDSLLDYNTTLKERRHVPIHALLLLHKTNWFLTVSKASNPELSAKARNNRRSRYMACVVGLSVVMEIFVDGNRTMTSLSFGKLMNFNFIAHTVSLSFNTGGVCAKMVNFGNRPSLRLGIVLDFAHSQTDVMPLSKSCGMILRDGVCMSLGLCLFANISNCLQDVSMTYDALHMNFDLGGKYFIASKHVCETRYSAFIVLNLQYMDSEASLLTFDPGCQSQTKSKACERQGQKPVRSLFDPGGVICTIGTGRTRSKIENSAEMVLLCGHLRFLQQCVKYVEGHWAFSGIVRFKLRFRCLGVPRGHKSMMITLADTMHVFGQHKGLKQKHVEHKWDRFIDGATRVLIQCLHQTVVGFNLTRGRAIPLEGWNDVKNCSREEWFIVTNILCRKEQLRETSKMFHKLVNGPDPPMDVDDDGKGIRDIIHFTSSLGTSFL